MPSNNIEIEQAVLGSLLLNVNAYPEVDAKLTAEDFVSEVHSDIYKCIKHLAESGKGTDYISVSRELDRNNLLERIGGVDYLKELQDTPVTARNAESYAESVKSQSLDRKFKIVLQQLLKISENPEGKSSNEILEEAETKIFDLAQNRINNETMRPIDELVGVSMDKIEDLMSKDGDLVGHSYGYKDIDALTLGLKEEELIIIAGRPSMGKTSLGMNIAEHVAMNEEGYVLVFSLEMSAESLTARMLGSRAGVSMKNVYSGTISDQQLEKLTRMGDELSKSNLLIDDAGNITPPEIRAKCRKVARAAREKGGIKLVLIDYIQLMQMPGRNDNRVSELSDISRSLKHLAKELKCPVIVLSQLNRNVDARENKRPRMSDLRAQPAWNHNGSTLLFGPDGMLYASFGDGGAAGDPWNNAQDTTNLLGSVIRIDVDNKDAGRGYSIPADNPITIEQHQQNPKLRRELWAWGLRNVWRMSFDRTTGELWAGDVGQNKWEEVSILRKGGNYGWKVREGAHRFGRNGTKNSEAFVEPVFEYNHKKGLSITGGHVYRGPQSALQGLYMCGDYVTRRLWIMRPNGMNPVEDVREFDLGRDGAFVASFGEDEAGEMYICDHVRANPGSGVRGRILKVVGR